ncbi:MAG: trimethylamine methyltransferase family protein [Actinomycetota bacterium]
MGRRRSNRDRRAARPVRSTVHHRQLVYPHEPYRTLSDDEVAHVHAEAKRLLQAHGIRVLLPEACGIFTAAGATVDDNQMVRIPADVVDEAVGRAPSVVRVGAPDPAKAITIGDRHLNFMPVGGPPFVTDLDRGRRPGTLEDYENLMRLVQGVDVLHANAPFVEAQDIPVDVRHLHITRSQLTLSDKPAFLFTRGRQRVQDMFEMLRIRHGVSPEDFVDQPLIWANINTNSPRQLDIPMALGIIDFARAGQVCAMTPFTLAGAMAPVSLAGALLLQHAEALAAITLAQFTRAGAPVIYGGFTSNVDLRSGSPAFGTPEAIRGGIATGQLARLIGVPWRSSGSSASPVEDAQGAWETMFNLHGAMRGGANFIMHSAGWQAGGLVASFEKLILDVEMLQTIVESWQPVDVSADELAFDAIADVEPGGHFFGETHTLERFETAFYDPIVATRASFEQWVEEGSLDARQRANAVWKQRLAEYEQPPIDDAIVAELDDFVARRTAEGGAPPD